jgi:UDP-glucose 4-epimerase
MDSKKVLVFGGTGSLGKTLIKRLATNNEVAVFSRDEEKHWTIKNQYKGYNLRFFVGDIRDYSRVKDVIDTYLPDDLIIASALKQVDTCELSPAESIKTNILGIQNVVDAVENTTHDGMRVCMVSTDKACSPVNVYGMCKAIAERVVLSRSLHSRKKVKFVATRYGNVLESRGSIIPLFKYQAQTSENLTVTHPDMTRFVMTLDESVDLILHALIEGESGQTWIPKLRSMKIIDIAEIFAERYSRGIKTIGIRPGEKLHESLISHAESIRTVDVGDRYYIEPAHSTVSEDCKMFEYTSETGNLSKDKLDKYLESLGIFEKSLSTFIGKSIEEIKS